MATREASLKLTLRSGSFQSQFGKVERNVAASGKRMGSALRVGISRGLGAAGRSLQNFGGKLKGHIRTAATIGGALTFGKLIKDAVTMQTQYRNIAFTIKKLPGGMMDWQDVNKLVANTAEDTAQSTQDLATSFHSLLQATGDLEFASGSLDEIGTAATGSGEKIEHVTTAAELLKRKFGLAADDMKGGLTTFIELTGSGGKSLEELTGRFAVMAGKARGAGLEGVDGLGQLLGVLKLLDDSIGEKADPGLKLMFDTLRKGSSQFKKLEKDANMKFDPDATALEKIRDLLTTVKGRAAAELVFTADARDVFDTLAKPFDLAMKEAQEKGLKRTDAVDKALEAFDKNIQGASQTTMTWKDIQKSANDKMKEDPSIQLRMAINKVEKAFQQPKMIEAIETLAKHLPAIAEKFADLFNWIMTNPWKAVGAAVGGKAALGVGGSLLTGAVAKAALGGAGAAGAGAAGAGAAGGAGALGAGAALPVLAAGAAGAIAGTALHKFVLDPTAKEGFASIEQAGDLMLDASRIASTGTHKEKLEALAAIRAKRQQVTSGRMGGMNEFFGGFASLLSGGDVKSPEAMIKETKAGLTSSEDKLIASMDRQVEKQIQQAKNFESLETATIAVTDAFKFVSRSFPASSPGGPPPTTGGPRGTSKLSQNPGAEPAKG